MIYFITAAFFLPETKGKTLEEIEEHFSGRAKSRADDAGWGRVFLEHVPSTQTPCIICYVC